MATGVKAQFPRGSAPGKVKRLQYLIEYMKAHRDFTPSFLLVCQGRSRSFLLVRSYRYLGDDDIVEFKVGRRRGGPSRIALEGAYLERYVNRHPSRLV
jgi:hypothetical protein